MPFKEECAINLLVSFPEKNHGFLSVGSNAFVNGNVPFMEECTIFGGMCHFWSDVPFMEECAIFGGMYYFWSNVPFMEECAIYGGMCHFWSNMPFLE